MTSIAVRSYASGQTDSFSIHKTAEQKGIPVGKIHENYDELERLMLDDFYDFIRARHGYIWVHWSMRDINYGFQAIEHRYKVLGGIPEKVNDSKKFDLARALVTIYGERYAPHPRLVSIVDMNQMTRRDFLNGQDEADAFERKEYVRLHQSTLRKADLLSSLLERAAEDRLVTAAPWFRRFGWSFAAVVEFIKEHWIVSFLTLVALLLTLIYRFKDLF